MQKQIFIPFLTCTVPEWNIRCLFLCIKWFCKLEYPDISCNDLIHTVRQRYIWYMFFLIWCARFHWFWARYSLKSVHQYLANTVHKSFGYLIPMPGQRFLSKATFASPIKPGYMETPPASQQDKQMQNLTSVAFLLASHLALSVEQCRTQVCSASASEVSVLFLLCRELFCLYTLSNL